jgi:hypothetical protein
LYREVSTDLLESLQEFSFFKKQNIWLLAILLRIFLTIVLLPFNNNTSAIYVPDRSRCIFIKIQNFSIHGVIDCQLGKLTQRYSVFCYIHSYTLFIKTGKTYGSYVWTHVSNCPMTKWKYKRYIVSCTSLSMFKLDASFIRIVWRYQKGH